MTIKDEKMTLKSIPHGGSRGYLKYPQGIRRNDSSERLGNAGL